MKAMEVIQPKNQFMKINYQLLYQKLGSLFYAVANADKHVRKSEGKALTEKISRVWLPLEGSTDEFGTNASQYIFFAFDRLHAEGVEAEVAFNEFSSYYHEHALSFDDVIKSKILRTTEAIANAFSGKNKLESTYLKRLKHLLKV